MKKAFSFILCLVILIFSVVGVSAKTDPDSKYYIEDLGFSIYTPLYDSATRDVNNLGISQEEYEELLKTFEENDIYYFGFTSLFMQASPLYRNAYTELYIYGYDSDIQSFSNLSDIVLNEIMESQKTDWEDSGVNVIKNEIYESYNSKYILTHYTDEEDIYYINYYTVENHKSIDIIMASHSGEPVANAKTDLVTIVNSIEFDEPTGMQNYEKTFTLSIAENGKLTPLGESLILTGVIVLVQIIAGVVVLIILLNKRKKRRQNALTQNANIKTKFCIYCGTQLKVSDTFCHRCGKNQIPYEEKENINP